MDIDNSELFFKIFRNIYLRNEISRHLKLYMEHGKRFYYNSLTKFKYKDYINQLFFPDGFKYGLDKVKFNYFSNLSSINFGEKFNQPIQIGQIPHQVQSIRFGLQFNSEIHELPNQLLYLYINVAFEQQLDQVLPPSLTHLEIHSTKMIDTKYLKYLPPNLKKLYFQNFNGDLVNGYLPESLTYLSLPRFNKSFQGLVLPKSLEYIYLNYFKDDSGDFQFPTSNLKQLNISMFFNRFNVNQFVKSKYLKHLNIGEFLYQEIDLSSLIHLENLSIVLAKKPDLPESKVVIPTSITELSICYYEDRDTRGSSFDMMNLLLLKKLEISIVNNSKLFKSPLIPSNVTDLVYKTPLLEFEKEFKFPNSIKRLNLPNYSDSYCGFDIEIEIIPNNVEELIIPAFFKGSLKYSIIPSTIKNLTINAGFDLGLLSQITHLEKLVVKSFNGQNFGIAKLPPNLKELYYESFRLFEITPNFFPESLTLLSLNAYDDFGQFKNLSLSECLPKQLIQFHAFKFNVNILSTFIPNSNFQIITHQNPNSLPCHLKKYLPKIK